MVRLPVHPAALEVAESGPTAAGIAKPTIQDTVQVTPQVTALLEVMEGELSRSELMSGLGLRNRAHFLNAYLQPALDAGLIEMTIPDKPQSRHQRYRLTASGAAQASEESVTIQVTIQDAIQVTPQVAALLDTVEGELSRAEIMSGLGLKNRAHFLGAYLQPALEAGLIEYTIPEKPNSRLQRYRLTDRGRRLLEGAKSRA